jgi:hypothetical protein
VITNYYAINDIYNTMGTALNLISGKGERGETGKV